MKLKDDPAMRSADLPISLMTATRKKVFKHSFLFIKNYSDKLLNVFLCASIYLSIYEIFALCGFLLLQKVYKIFVSITHAFRCLQLRTKDNTKSIGVLII